MDPRLDTLRHALWPAQSGAGRDFLAQITVGSVMRRYDLFRVFIAQFIKTELAAVSDITRLADECFGVERVQGIQCAQMLLAIDQPAVP